MGFDRYALALFSGKSVQHAKHFYLPCGLASRDLDRRHGLNRVDVASVFCLPWHADVVCRGRAQNAQVAALG